VCLMVVAVPANKIERRIRAALLPCLAVPCACRFLPDAGGGHKQGKWVLFLRIQQASLRHLLDLIHTLPSMAACSSMHACSKYLASFPVRLSSRDAQTAARIVSMAMHFLCNLHYTCYVLACNCFLYVSYTCSAAAPFCSTTAHWGVLSPPPLKACSRQSQT
jgi:hypothetical protein